MWEVLGEYQGPPIFKVFVRYSMARMSRRIEEKSFKIYVTDSLRLAPQMEYLGKRWGDIIDVSKRREQEKSADEIADSVLSRLGA